MFGGALSDGGNQFGRDLSIIVNLPVAVGGREYVVGTEAIGWMRGLIG